MVCVYVSDSECEQLKCKETGYCVANDLKCNREPNCGWSDRTDEEDCKNKFTSCDNTLFYENENSQSIQLIYTWLTINLFIIQTFLTL